EALAVSPDGTRVLAADRAVPLRMVKMATSVEVERFSGHPGGSVAVAFSPTGRLAVSGGREPMIRIWEVSSGKQRRELSGGSVWDVLAALRAGRTTVLKLPAAELEFLWKDLASEDASTAAVAVQRLARAHPQVVPLLSKRIAPVLKEELTRLIRDLDSDKFTK